MFLSGEKDVGSCKQAEVEVQRAQGHVTVWRLRHEGSERDWWTLWTLELTGWEQHSNLGTLIHGRLIDPNKVTLLLHA